MDYRALALQKAQKYGLDPRIYLRMIGVESGYNPRATSHKGAMGLGQLMPATAKRFGVTDPYDPEQNTEASAKYVRWLLDRYGGNYELALAGYNAGEAAVDRYGGVPPYKETQGYVKKILGPDVRLAGGDELPPEMQLAGDPMTGYADFQMPPQQQSTPGRRSLPPSLSAPTPPSFSESLFSNPWLQLGMGILANPQGALGSPMAGIAQGFMQAQQMRNAQLGKELYARQLSQKEFELMGLDQPSELEWADLALRQGRLGLDQQILRQRAQEFERGPQSTPQPGAIYYPETDSFVSVPDTRSASLYENPDVQAGRAIVVGLPPGSTIGKSDKSSLKAEDRIRGLQSRIQYLDQTIAEVEAEPWTTSMFAPARKFIGGAAESIATELDRFGIAPSLSATFKNVSKGSGAAQVAAMDFRMATAASMAARDIINYGDPRMSDTDRRAANEILSRAGNFTDPVTSKQCLVELRNYQMMQLERDGGRYTPSAAGTPTTPQQVGQPGLPPEAPPSGGGAGPVRNADGSWTLPDGQVIPSDKIIR